MNSDLTDKETGLIEKKSEKYEWRRQVEWKGERKKDSTYTRIVPSHDVSNDNRSIFEFQLERKKKTSLEKGVWVTSTLRNLTATEAAAESVADMDHHPAEESSSHQWPRDELQNEPTKH